MLAYERAGKKIPPMTGENSKQFLKMWADKKFAAMAVGNPNWMGAMAILAGVLAQQGKDVVSPIDVPIPVITNDNARRRSSNAARTSRTTASSIPPTPGTRCRR